MKHSISWQEKYCLVEFTGDINKRDIELANKYVHGDKRIYKLPASIWDLSKCNSISLEPKDLYYSMAVDIGSSRSINEHKLAFIIDNSNAIEAFSMYINDCIKYGSPWEFKIFNTMHGVEEWLNT